MTDFSKLVRWDADYYKSLSDDDCIICLSERQIYLLGQVLEQLHWHKTRWVGDTTGLDFKAIEAAVTYQLGERVTCQSLALLLERIKELDQKVDYIFQQISIDNGNPTFGSNTTVVTNVHTPSELTALGVSAAVCDNAGKDAVYGAVNTLVRYIVQNNTDFLERLAQAFNPSESVAKLISAIPVVGLLPIDEMFDYASFLADELLQEYNAIVDETLIQTVVCDIYCISVANGCRLDFNDVYSYFAQKCAPTLGNAATTFLQLVQFGLTGTFSGDDYFYYMSYLQLMTVGLGEYFLALNSVEPFAIKVREGFANPDNAWMLHCTNCPVYTHWEYEWDFAWGLGEFAVISGTTLASGYLKSWDNNQVEQCAALMNFDKPYNIENIAIDAWGNEYIGNGSDDFVRLSVYPQINLGGTELVVFSRSFITTVVRTIWCEESIVGDNSSRSLRIWGNSTDRTANTFVRIYRVRIVGANNGNGKPVLATWKTYEPLCNEF